MVMTIKINYDGDIRRLALEEVTYDAVLKMVTESFANVNKEELEMKYEDEEGDMCTLVALTFPDFLATQEGKKVSKIQVSKKKTLTTSSGPCESKHDAPKSTTTPQANPMKSQVKDESTNTNGLKNNDETTKESAKANSAKSNDENTKDGSSDGFNWGHWGHGGHSHGGCKGPFKFLLWIKALKDDGVLNPQVFASLFVQWLPFITQKVTRKLDMINYMVKEGLSATMSSFLLVLQHHVEAVPALQVYAVQFKGIVEQEPDAPLLGDTLRSFLIAMQGLAFDVQVNFVEQLSEAVFPLLDDMMADLPEWEQKPWWMQGPLVHHGVSCDHCGAVPIVGPRFKCTSCPDYDLCGNCYPQKTAIHGPVSPNAAPHEFECIMSPQWHCGKGHGKGWKGCGKGHKGFGKGHMFHHFMPWLHHVHGMMGGGMMDGGFKGWPKGWGKGEMHQAWTNGQNGQDGHSI